MNSIFEAKNIVFDGTEAYFRIADISGINPNNDARVMTIEAWIFASSFPGDENSDPAIDQCGVLTFGGSGEGQKYWLLRSDGTLELGIENGPGLNPAISLNT